MLGGVIEKHVIQIQGFSFMSYQKLHPVFQALLLFRLVLLWVQVTEPLIRTQKQIEEVRRWGAMATEQR